MAQATQKKPRYEGTRVTREQYLDLEDDGFLYDMIDGVLHMSPSPFFEHNKILSRILYLLENHLHNSRDGEVVPETDVFLPDGGDVVRPDISVILKPNYGIIFGHIHGAPDMIVEVLSDTTRERDLGIKAERYLKNGVSEYWIADPRAKTMENRINADRKNWIKIQGKKLESKLLQGLTIDTADVFPNIA